MKKIFLILISIFLCLDVSDVGSVYARGKGTAPGPKAKPAKARKQQRTNPPGPKGGPGKGPKHKADVNTKWEKRADANKDGVVQKAEKNRWDNRPGRGNPPGPKGGPGKGLKNKASVDNKWEKRADANNDGVVDRAEKQRWDNDHATKSVSF